MQLVCPNCLAVNRVARERLAEAPVCGKCRARLLPSKPIALDDGTFDRYVDKGDLPVLVDFWAEWCPPCHLMAPMLDEVARQRPDVRVAKVDTAVGESIAARFGVRSIPTPVPRRRRKELALLTSAVPALNPLASIGQSLAAQPQGKAS